MFAQDSSLPMQMLVSKCHVVPHHLQDAISIRERAIAEVRSL